VPADLDQEGEKGANYAGREAGREEGERAGGRAGERAGGREGGGAGGREGGRAREGGREGGREGLDIAPATRHVETWGSYVGQSPGDFWWFLGNFWWFLNPPPSPWFRTPNFSEQKVRNQIFLRRNDCS
jgi:hypothetical protein